MTSGNKLSPTITGTRRAILEHLLGTDANAVTLANHLRINISAIRSHLDVLEVAGLVSSRREPAARGRPKRLYTLTPLALTLFPQKNAHFISALFQAIERSLDTKTINALIGHTVKALWQQLLPEKPSGSLRDRLAAITQALNIAGSYASVKQEQGAFIIVIRNFIFREAFSTFSTTINSRINVQFLRELQRMLGPVWVEWTDTPTVGDHLRRIRVTPRKEQT